MISSCTQLIWAALSRACDSTRSNWAKAGQAPLDSTQANSAGLVNSGRLVTPLRSLLLLDLKFLFVQKTMARKIPFPLISLGHFACSPLAPLRPASGRSHEQSACVCVCVPYAPAAGGWRLALAAAGAITGHVRTTPRQPVHWSAGSVCHWAPL